MKATELTDNNFETLVEKNEGVVMVDFWAEWCGPCKMIGPIIEQLAGEYEGKALIGKVDVDNNPEVAMKYSVRSIPTVLVFKNGQIVDTKIGAAPKSQYVNALEAQLVEA